MRPRSVRSFLTIKWLWTAEAAKRAGIAAWSLSTPRSERTKILASVLANSSACWHSSSKAAFKPSKPKAGLKRIGKVTDFKRSQSIFLMLANSWLVKIGRRMEIAAVPSLFGSVKLPEFPNITRVEVTISSRIQSIGGLVTWAKSCLK